jgi:hypothetical protein
MFLVTTKQELREAVPDLLNPFSDGFAAVTLG